MAPQESQSGADGPRNGSARAAALSESHHDKPQSAPSDPVAALVCHPRRSNVFNCISLGRPQGIKELAVKDLEYRKRAEKKEAKARKDAALWERKARRNREGRDRDERRRASRERVRQNKKDKALRHAEEKRVEDYYGIRGYDPNAGMLRSNRERAMKARAEQGEHVGQERQGPPSRKLDVEQTWGFEYGKPIQQDGKGHYSGHDENCGEHYGSSAAAISDGG
ncbi:hypothetical protein A1O7_04408 [Cladophialophora yegresii CBS 114405]|uniref:Uncharacterized protein n=1 Tax=Cladophialophora yegresii CBS 114405 TaxID=1182544 RepID=W9W6V0_9EURO|nr:uncharacterized protein A1O7_04408 [Cladophialophora yegresii CBS 114405]EXJ60256.1 hypothetical protein A1O7_04408 [Cladophialophora yegresii CBS 114405]